MYLWAKWDEDYKSSDSSTKVKWDWSNPVLRSWCLSAEPWSSERLTGSLPTQVGVNEWTDEEAVLLFIIVVTTDHRALVFVRTAKLVQPSKQSIQFCWKGNDHLAAYSNFGICCPCWCIPFRVTCLDFSMKPSCIFISQQSILGELLCILLYSGSGSSKFLVLSIYLVRMLSGLFLKDLLLHLPSVNSPNTFLCNPSSLNYCHSVLCMS